MEENTYALFCMAKDLMKKNDFLNASLLLEKAVAQEPEKGSIREALAICYFNMGFYGPSKAHFDRALQIDASNDFAHYGMGMCLLKEKSFNRALGHFKIAKFMKPGLRIYEDAIRRYNKS
jgi:tetratricopeptide (TPR) repeat protein